MNDFYDELLVESYVIMPNHIHIMLMVKGGDDGPSGTPVPTVQNSVVSRFLSTLKRFCNKEYGNTVLMTTLFAAARITRSIYAIFTKIGCGGIVMNYIRKSKKTLADASVFYFHSFSSTMASAFSAFSASTVQPAARI